jgi:ankyrin repeat protein
MENIFNLIKQQNFIEIYDIIKSKKLTSLDFRDTNYNYFIQYVINYNQYNLLKLILELYNIRIDIIDTDGRSILYNCIKYNYIDILNLLIEYNKTEIGISIIDIKDRLGLTSLHYSIIFNNYDAFIILLNNNADPYLFTNDGNNVFMLALVYKRNNMISHLINKFINNINFTNLSGENLLQIAVNNNNTIVINKLLETNINFNNITYDGLTVLHQSIILDNFDLFKKLLEYANGIDINKPDFYGYTPLHYIIENKKLDYLTLFFTKSNITSFNISNIHGELPLHKLLTYSNDIIKNIMPIIKRMIIETDLNMQNNQGITCFIQIINNNQLKLFKNILITKPLIFYIEDNNSKIIKMTDDILDILVESYYNQIQINKNDLILEWEKMCINKDCRDKIKETIVKEKRTLPKTITNNLKIDNGIITKFCFYTGTPIDILFGLILLNNKFKNKKLNIVLDRPLTINLALETNYKNIGLDYPYKLDFSNIQIIWSYQKIFYPTYFDNAINKLKLISKYIAIPIGIETSLGAHSNILFWDIDKKTIERFEPNGSNYPIGLNYNPELLDKILEMKLKSFNKDIIYYSPNKFLPTIGFQILENLEIDKCRKIGDPNGFCGVWCIWWVYQRMLNIDVSKLNITNFASELIKYIKYDNQSFKNIIRNFSKKITEIRDEYLSKYKLDINDWISGSYNEEILDKLEKDIKF